MAELRMQRRARRAEQDAERSVGSGRSGFESGFSPPCKVRGVQTGVEPACEGLDGMLHWETAGGT